MRKGWFHTGDLAKSDPTGYLTITDAQGADHPGGQNIAPSEIEEVAILYAEVIDCAVVGVPHATLGEVPYLFVVAEQGQLDEEALLAHCRRRPVVLQDPEATHIVSEFRGRIRKDQCVQVWWEALKSVE